MGVNLRDLITKRKTLELKDLKGRIIAIDAHNALYQFLTRIRQRDGTPLMDRRGRVTSHLSGLLYRTVNLVENGIKPVYVFDGKPPEIKALEILRRKELKEEMRKKYEEALERGDIEEMRKYAAAMTQLTSEHVEQAKRLLDVMGIPWVQAPGEGEAQAAYMTVKEDVWASASQDYDSLLFGAKRLVRNLTVTGERKLPGKDVTVEVPIELIELDEVLKELGITREQLIMVAIFLGTDYNPDGVKGIGAKGALKLVKERKDPKHVFAPYKSRFPVEPEVIMDIFLNPNVTDDYKLEWREPNREGLIRLLCHEFDFSMERVERAYERLAKGFEETFKQAGLEAWFKKS